MVKLEKPLVRETNLVHRMCPVIIELRPDKIVFRLKGKRMRTEVSLQDVFRNTRMS